MNGVRPLPNLNRSLAARLQIRQRRPRPFLLQRPWHRRRLVQSEGIRLHRHRWVNDGDLEITNGSVRAPSVLNDARSTLPSGTLQRLALRSESDPVRKFNHCNAVASPRVQARSVGLDLQHDLKQRSLRKHRPARKRDKGRVGHLFRQIGETASALFELLITNPALPASLRSRSHRAGDD
jgi:hypothetical protein